MSVRVVLDMDGFDELRRDPGMIADLARRGAAIAAAAGPGFLVDPPEVSQNRPFVRVWSATHAARHAEATTGALTRAIDAGRV